MGPIRLIPAWPEHPGMSGCLAQPDRSRFFQKLPDSGHFTIEPRINMGTGEFNLALYLSVFVVSGFASGFVSGFFGIGGGFVRMPLFLFLFPQFMVHGEDIMHVAVATSLALGIPSSIISLRKRLVAGTFDTSYFKGWSVGLTIGALIGAALFPFMPATVLEVLYLFVLIFFAVYFAFIPDTLVLAKAPPVGLRRFFISGGISTYVVMTGVGSGSACTFALKASSMDLKSAMAIATASSLIVNVLGAAACIATGIGQPGLPEWNVGFIDGFVFLTMLPGILLSAGWGAKLSLGIDKKLLKRIYAGFLMLVTAYSGYSLFTSLAAS